MTKGGRATFVPSHTQQHAHHRQINVMCHSLLRPHGLTSAAASRSSTMQQGGRRQVCETGQQVGPVEKV